MTRKRFPRLLAALGHACVTCEATAARGTSPDALAPIFSSREPSEPGEGDKGDEVATSAVRSLCHDGPGLEWDVVASGRRTRCYHWHHAYRQVRAWRACGRSRAGISAHLLRGDAGVCVDGWPLAVAARHKVKVVSMHR